MLKTVEIRPIGSRRIEQKTCERYGYGYSTWKGKEVQVASFEEDGEVVAQKIRFTDEDGRKTFRTLGDSTKIGLWGKTRVRPSGRLVIVTEGETDCLAVSQVFGNKYSVVSVPHGASQARKYLAKDLRWLLNFESVVLCFDEDDAGRKAIEDCKDLFEPGTLKIARLPLKDPCEMLKAHRTDELYRAIWDAQSYTPACLLTGGELAERGRDRFILEAGHWPFSKLDEMTDGLRYRELVMLCAGSGVGKSTMCDEVVGARLAAGHTVCVMALESDPYQTIRGAYTVHSSQPLKLVHGEESYEAFDAAQSEWGDRLYVFDGFGASDPDELLNLIRYAVKGLGCDTVVLDHISLIVSSMQTDDERRAIDELMTSLRKLVQELGVLLFCVSHLKRPQGRGHEDGAMTSLSHLRGSASLAQLSDLVIGLERDGQAEEEIERDLVTVRVLKNRYTGRTGPAGHLRYHRDTGRLLEVNPEEDFADSEFGGAE